MDNEQLKSLRILRQHVPAEVLINITTEGLEFKTNRFTEVLSYKTLRVLKQTDPDRFFQNVGKQIRDIHQQQK